MTVETLPPPYDEALPDVISETLRAINDSDLTIAAEGDTVMLRVRDFWGDLAWESGAKAMRQLRGAVILAWLDLVKRGAVTGPISSAGVADIALLAVPLLRTPAEVEAEERRKSAAAIIEKIAALPLPQGA